LTQVLVQTPAHSQMAGALSYWSPTPVQPGTLVRVPLGQRELLGVVWPSESPAAPEVALDPAKLRPITAALDALPPLNHHWRALITSPPATTNARRAKWRWRPCRRNCAT